MVREQRDGGKGAKVQGTVVREQREKTKNGQMGDQRFGDDCSVGQECGISRREARLYSGGIHVGGV